MECLPAILIPDEVIREILLFLPVKSIVRFMSVCKSWKLIVSDPRFVKLHLHRSSANTAHFAHTRLLFDLINSHIDKPFDQTDCSASVSFSSQHQKGHDLYPIENGYELIGVCNGLASVMKLDYSFAKNLQCSVVRVRLWNPARRLSSQVSPPLYLLEPNYYTFGFGYDCLNDTYKTVAVNRKERVVRVYDMGGTCWRMIQSFPAPAIELVSLQNGVYVRGSLNWIVTNTDVPIIVSLDLGREEYSQFSLPDSLHNEELFRFPILGVLKDCLCILHNEGRTRFLVWQMNDVGAWIQLFNFERTTLLNPFGFVLSQNDEILLMSRHEVVLYNQRYNTFEFCNVCNHHSIYSWNADNQVESLVLPG
ncbi:F-box/kelch-repeat protein At3g23880-like [Lotus japonicus]|uniref:F-box/kelch-repeat protein At3g23880-like n=1 Tax=Lotus japonicus TaxID=34305 RepID=UPI00258A4CEF|nr:F-box/kelch-repeat protein At3g23880-like [Lotus japonicus]